MVSYLPGQNKILKSKLLAAFIVFQIAEQIDLYNINSVIMLTMLECGCGGRPMSGHSRLFNRLTPAQLCSPRDIRKSRDRLGKRSTLRLNRMLEY